MSHPAMSMKVQAVCSEIFWAARLNLMWMVFTLLGGVVLGLGPATMAAYVVARRHARGESIQWRDYASAYRREFVRGSLLVLPVSVVATVLVGNLLYLSAPGTSPGTAAAGGLLVATYAALVVLAAAGAYLGPLYAHYELPLRDYLPKASLVALTRPAATALLLFALSAVAFVVATAPVLAPIVGVGAWISLNTWLCQRFFEENEARLQAKGNQ
ncbi:YesL family protein [Nonomuraea maritima]|uniref:YesL family protein n=1 Tax=Nonomuraea maritima TaxID=683260 RepID=UPI00372120E6